MSQFFIQINEIVESVESLGRLWIFLGFVADSLRGLRILFGVPTDSIRLLNHLLVFSTSLVILLILQRLLTNSL